MDEGESLGDSKDRFKNNVNAVDALGGSCFAIA
jgi:hypothetical protein